MAEQSIPDYAAAWEKEQAFWAAHPVQRFDLESTSHGYDTWQEMVLRQESGDWIRAEDFRATVEALQAQVSCLEARARSAEAMAKTARYYSDYARTSEAITAERADYLEKLLEDRKGEQP